MTFRLEWNEEKERKRERERERERERGVWELLEKLSGVMRILCYSE